MTFKYKQEAIPAIIYFIISIAALLYVFLFAPAGASLSGVGLALLTLPWSLIGVAILDYLHLDNIKLTVILAVIYVMINTALWLIICGYFKKSK